jgi:hypothetical protein
VSDFLSRLAARAAGQAPLAQPRVPTRFEDPGEAAEPLDVVAGRAPSEPAADVAAAVSPVTPPPRPPLPPAAAPGAPHVAEAPARTPMPAPPAPLVEDHAVTEPLGAAQPARERVASEPPAAVPPSPAAAPPAVAVTAAGRPRNPGAVAPSPAGPADIAAPPPEPPPVRIHIGRLEVRANLEPVPATKPERRRPSEPELSLTDYLRGAG